MFGYPPNSKNFFLACPREQLLTSDRMVQIGMIFNLICFSILDNNMKQLTSLTAPFWHNLYTILCFMRLLIGGLMRFFWPLCLACIRLDSQLLQIFFSVGVYMIWQERNKRLHSSLILSILDNLHCARWRPYKLCFERSCLVLGEVHQIWPS